MKRPAYASFRHLGIVTDLPAQDVAPEHWTAGANVVFEDGSSVRAGGYQEFVPLPVGFGGQPQFAFNVVAHAVSYWIFCNASKIYVTDGTTHWDITPAAGIADAQGGEWTGCLINGIPVLNNPKFAPVYWSLDVSKRCAPLPGWPAGTTCAAMRAFKYHLFALGVREASAPESESVVWWSAAAPAGYIPDQWLPAPSNDAGDVQLVDTPGRVVDGLALRDLFIVYKETSTYALAYIGGQYVFSSRKLFLTTGLQSVNCVSEIAGAHWAFTGADVIRHDGSSIESVVQDKVRRQLLGTIDPTWAHLSCVLDRRRVNQFWVAIPTMGADALNRVYCINALTGDIGMRDIPGCMHMSRGYVSQAVGNVPWDSDAQAWEDDPSLWDSQTFSPTDDTVILADYDNSKLLVCDTVSTANDLPVTAFLERTNLSLGDEVSRNLITSIIPRIEGTEGERLEVSVGAQAYFGSPIKWGTPQDFIIGSTNRCDFQVEGRFAAVRFAGTTRGQWRVHSYKLELVPQGLL